MNVNRVKNVEIRFNSIKNKKTKADFTTLVFIILKYIVCL